MSLKRYLCVGGSLDNEWLTLFNDDGHHRQTVRAGGAHSAAVRGQFEEYRMLRVVDRDSRSHEIMAISTLTDVQALRRWRPRVSA
ncbi:hypothetical protein [Terrarubrum flagellatum]|uniref:hypothetical protein n=1 Tax=Terrirubrum flagellatum TaxID=2895980 RepID=UPI00314513F3